MVEYVPMPDEGGRLMTPPPTANRAWVEKEPHGVRGVKEVLIAGQAGGLARRAGRPPLGAVDVEDRVPAALPAARRDTRKLTLHWYRDGQAYG